MRSKSLFPSLAFLVSLACASSDGLIDQRVLDCGPGHDIGIQVGLQGGGGSERFPDDPVMLVEVANNSHSDVVVKFIRVEPDDRAKAFIGGGSLRPGETIAEGKARVFEVALDSRRLPSLDNPRPVTRMPPSLEMIVSVGLANGDTYRCAFIVTPAL